MFELVTPYQLKDLQSRVAREKPPIAMPLLQSVCIIIEYPTPQNWNGDQYTLYLVRILSPIYVRRVPCES